MYYTKITNPHQIAIIENTIANHGLSLELEGCPSALVLEIQKSYCPEDETEAISLELWYLLDSQG